jgi:hypothetical protein
MASASHRYSTAANAMAVQLGRHSSEQRNSSDDDAKEADCSPSQHKKQMLERESDDNDGAFSNNVSEGLPVLESSSGDMKKNLSRNLRNSSSRMVTRNHGSVSQYALKTTGN